MTKQTAGLHLDPKTGATVAAPTTTKPAAAPKASRAQTEPKPKAEPKPRVVRTIVPFDQVLALLAGLRMSKSDLGRATGVTPSLVSEWVGSGRKSGLNAARWDEVQAAARDYAAKRDAVAAKLAQENAEAEATEAAAAAK